MKKIIVINGSAGSGKDTFVEFFKTHAPESIPVYNHSTIDSVKAVARSFFGWNGEKSERSRRFLSDLKDAWTAFNDGPFEELKLKIYRTSKGIIFIHVREPIEITKIKDYYKENCITLLIKRPGIDLPDNHADRNTWNYPYENIVLNDSGLPKLESAAKAFLKLWSEN